MPRARARTSPKSLEQDFAALAQDRAKITKPVRAIFVLTVQNGRATVAGGHTSADAVIKLAGAENAAGGIEGYKPLVEEAATELAPDAIVTMRHSSATFTSDQILSVKGLQASPAGQNKRVIEMDGLYLLSFGPRSAHAARDLMAALYPGSRRGARENDGRGRPARNRLSPRTGAASWRPAFCSARRCFSSWRCSYHSPSVRRASRSPRCRASSPPGSAAKDDAATAREQLVLIDIRLPRTLLAMFVGASLAVAGAMMQGLFRNPLADPGLIGVSSVPHSPRSRRLRSATASRRRSCSRSASMRFP